MLIETVFDAAPLPESITPEQRAALDRWLVEADRIFEPATREHLLTAATTLTTLRGWYVPDLSEGQQRERLRGYMQAVADMPSWGVHAGLAEATRLATRLPSTGEWRQYCADAMGLGWKRYCRAKRLLCAPVVAPREQRDNCSGDLRLQLLAACKAALNGMDVDQALSMAERGKFNVN